MEESLLYHEKQVAALCGVHCLNTLLQGPYFSEIDLAQIAQELDAAEQSFMMEGGTEAEDYLKYIAEGSGNVAADGMFSSQVLSKALDTDGPGVWISPAQARAATKDAADARKQGYVKAALDGAMSQASKKGKIVQLQSRHAAGQQQSGAGPSSMDMDMSETDMDLARALAASLAGANAEAAASAGLTSHHTPEAEAGGEWEEEDPELASALAASLAASSSAPDASAKRASADVAVVTPPEPDAAPGVLELMLRLPDGTRLQRRFLSSATIGALASFLANDHSLDMAQHRICTSFPFKKVLAAVQQSLADAGLNNREVLVVEKKR
ncbi:hypothetical protein WJX84_005359 [Apatococcus fuscideae]|uniref:ubiquitinyl hydrolase 1 n=1 Tax=Apatococcus fuscideae TaxID=2026836 RepID=A0AAW1S9K8_9CHLO